MAISAIELQKRKRTAENWERYLPLPRLGADVIQCCVGSLKGYGINLPEASAISITELIMMALTFRANQLEATYQEGTA